MDFRISVCGGGRERVKQQRIKEGSRGEKGGGGNRVGGRKWNRNQEDWKERRDRGEMVEGEWGADGMEDGRMEEGNERGRMEEGMRERGMEERGE